MSTIKIGFVGCGAISDIYLNNITNLYKEIEIIGVCDLIRERAEKAVSQYNIPKLYNDMYELFADPEVDIVLNITRPYEHYEVSKAALLAGKHVYSEKPLAATLAEGRELVAIAKEKGLLLGGAPDTFMGAGIQTCKKLIEDGYKYGGGPMMDMGPYYITAITNLIGNVTDVFAMTKKSFDQRVITSQPHYGEIVDVDVDTYVAGTMRFDNGAIVTLFTTFDVHARKDAIEIYGTKGTLYVPDPNGFGGPVKLYRPENEGGPMEIPLLFPYAQNSRALGLADMAKSLQTGRRSRTNCDLTLHMLEVMEGFKTSGKERREVAIESRFEKRPIMPNLPLTGYLD